MFYKKWNRFWRFWRQRLTQGWDDSETWNLFYEITEYTLPRLKRFREIHKTCPRDLTVEEWDAILGKIEYALQQISDEHDDNAPEMTLEQVVERNRKVGEGLALFGKWFEDLWW